MHPVTSGPRGISMEVPIIGDEKPRPGEMEPSAFICAGCFDRVQETKYGAGFRGCGSVRADREYRLCPKCLSAVRKFLESLPEFWRRHMEGSR
jgi:hypothetical protein